MSFAAVRGYFRSRMNGLGHKEHTDAFNWQNIPEKIQNRAYHIETSTGFGNGQNQTVIDANQDVTVRLFILGYRDTGSRIDAAIAFADEAICDIVNPINANGTLIKTAKFVSMNVLPRSESNDNTIIVEINFTARLMIRTV